MNAFLKIDPAQPHFPSEHRNANRRGRLSRNAQGRRRIALSDTTIEAMIRRCGLRMIAAVNGNYELALHWYYRVRHYAELAGR